MRNNQVIRWSRELEVGSFRPRPQRTKIIIMDFFPKFNGKLLVSTKQGEGPNFSLGCVEFGRV